MPPLLLKDMRSTNLYEILTDNNNRFISIKLI